MPRQRRHESEDLEDYEVLDTSDTLCGAPGDDPLDRGIATPERWSLAIRYGSTIDEQRSAGSIDRWLIQEDPDDSPDDDSRPAGVSRDEDGVSWDENATDGDIDRLRADAGPDPRAGRLITAADGTAVYLDTGVGQVARDAGIDGGGATAEEAALHLLADGDTGP
jgi:hypothetical protein